MRNYTKILGVTLLEIMLVLAIAAMVIVMSIRYYQSATISQQVNFTMSEVQAIAAAMDNLAIGQGSYSGITTAQLTSVVGASNLKSATNATITVTPSTTTYAVSIPVNDAICQSVIAKLKANPRIGTATPAPACASGTITYTYDNTK